MRLLCLLFKSFIKISHLENRVSLFLLSVHVIQCKISPLLTSRTIVFSRRLLTAGHGACCLRALCGWLAALLHWLAGLLRAELLMDHATRHLFCCILLVALLHPSPCVLQIKVLFSSVTLHYSSVMLNDGH
jgi:hypothetical protein